MKVHIIALNIRMCKHCVVLSGETHHQIGVGVQTKKKNVVSNQLRKVQ